MNRNQWTASVGMDGRNALESAGGEASGIAVHVDPGRIMALKAGRAVGVEQGNEMQAQAAGQRPDQAVLRVPGQKREESASAMVAVFSSPCIWDQASTPTSPSPTDTMRSGRPLALSPTLSHASAALPLRMGSRAFE